jgi:Fe-S-cluster containining protein
MLKKFFENRKNKNLCEGCNMCCNYVTVEIDTPETKDDFDQIVWYINHKNVVVYQDFDDAWNVEFETPCLHMTEKGYCGVYNERPDICREYSQDECLKYGEGEICKIIFKTKQDVIDYVQKNTDIKDLK